MNQVLHNLRDMVDNFDLSEKNKMTNTEPLSSSKIPPAADLSLSESPSAFSNLASVRSITARTFDNNLGKLTVLCEKSTENSLTSLTSPPRLDKRPIPDSLAQPPLYIGTTLDPSFDILRSRYVPNHNIGESSGSLTTEHLFVSEGRGNVNAYSELDSSAQSINSYIRTDQNAEIKRPAQSGAGNLMYPESMGRCPTSDPSESWRNPIRSIVDLEYGLEQLGSSNHWSLPYAQHSTLSSTDSGIASPPMGVTNVAEQQHKFSPAAAAAAAAVAAVAAWGSSSGEPPVSGSSAKMDSVTANSLLPSFSSLEHHQHACSQPGVTEGQRHHHHPHLQRQEQSHSSTLGNCSFSSIISPNDMSTYNPGLESNSHGSFEAGDLTEERRCKVETMTHSLASPTYASLSSAATAAAAAAAALVSCSNASSSYYDFPRYFR